MYYLWEVLKIKALFTYDYGKENMNKIRELGYEVIIQDEAKVKYNDDIKDTEVMVCYNPFNSLDIAKLEKLKWIQLSSIGIDQAPVKEIIRNNIILTNNKGGYSIPMGEWIVLKVLELYKNSVGFYEKQREKLWKMDTSLLELYNKTVGFIGTGSISIEGAKRLQGFGVNIIGLNTEGKNVKYFDKCYPTSEIKDMVSQCDVIVIAIPSTERTHHLVNKDLIDSMKDGVKIINVARGSIINENDLIDGLTKGKIGGAALDVFETEPLDNSSPLWTIDNVLVTPHNSWISEMRNERRFDIIFENLKRYMQKDDLINVVDVTKGY